MVMCKYFLQGTCRFGSSCKFEHDRGNTSWNYQSQQNYSSPLMGPATKLPPQAQQTTAGPTDMGILVKSLINDMALAEKGGQWVLSCYGPLKDKPCFPGFEDQSFEEIRLLYYEAMKGGTIEQFKQQWQSIVQQSLMKMKALQSPSVEAMNMLKTIYNTPINPQPTGDGKSSVFGGTTNSNFGNSGGLFGQNQQQSNAFGQQNQSATSIFATANKNLFGGNQQTAVQGSSNVFGQSVFGQQQQNIFGSSSQQQQQQQQQQQKQQSIFGSQNVFGGQQTSNSLFGTQVGGSSGSSSGSIFGGSHASSTSGSLSGSSQNTVVQAATNSGSIFGTGMQVQPVAANSPGFGQTQQGSSAPSGGLLSQHGASSTSGNLFMQQPGFGGNFAATPSSSSGLFGQQQNTNPPTFTSSGGLFGQQQQGINPVTSVPSGGLFGQQQGVTNVASTPSSGLFGQQQGVTNVASTPSSGLFGQQQGVTNVASTPSSGLFGQQQGVSTSSSGGLFTQQQNVKTTSGGLFGQQQPSTTSAGLFSQQQQGESIFSQQPQGNPGLPFQQGFGQQTDSSRNGGHSMFPQAAQIVDRNVYSKIEDLSETDIKWFESDELDVENIPEKPPTYEMCFGTSSIR